MSTKTLKEIRAILASVNSITNNCGLLSLFNIVEVCATFDGFEATRNVVLLTMLLAIEMIEFGIICCTDVVISEVEEYEDTLILKISVLEDVILLTNSVLIVEQLKIEVELGSYCLI